MRGLVIVREFPGLAGLERDMRSPPVCRSGALSFPERGDAICRQAPGYDRSAVSPHFPGQDCEEGEFSEYITHTLHLADQFLSDRVTDDQEFIGLFMNWGFDLTNGAGQRLRSSIHLYQVMEGLARGWLPPKPTETLRPWRRPQTVGAAWALNRYG